MNKAYQTLSAGPIFFLTFLGMIGNIVYIHTFIDDDTDRSAWLAVMLGFCLMIPFALWIIRLAKSYPGKNIFEIIELKWGKLASAPVSVLYAVVNLAAAVAMINLFTQLIKVFFLQLTPCWVIMLVVMASAFIIVTKGIYVFGNVVMLLGFISLVNYFGSFTFAFFDMKIQLEYVIPVFNTTPLGFSTGVLFTAGAVCECILLLMAIMSDITFTSKNKISLIAAIVSSAVIFALAVFIVIAIMSPELAKRVAFGGVNAAKVIQIGSYIRGLEVIVCGTYQFIAVGKVAMSLYCAWTAIGTAFFKKKPVVVLAVCSAGTYFASMYLNSYSRAYFFGIFLAKFVLFPLTAVILLLASIGGAIKTRKSRSASQ